MAVKQNTFADLNVGDSFIALNPEKSINKTLPVVKKLPRGIDEDGKKFNAIFLTDSRVLWVDPTKLIVHVY